MVSEDLASSFELKSEEGMDEEKQCMEPNKEGILELEGCSKNDK